MSTAISTVISVGEIVVSTINNIGEAIQKIEEISKQIDELSAKAGVKGQSLSTSIQDIKDLVVGEGLAEILSDVLSAAQKLSEWAKGYHSDIQAILHKGWMAIKGIVEGITSFLETQTVTIGKVWSILKLIVDGWGLLAAVAFPVILDKLNGTVKVMNAMVNLGYIFGKLMIDAVGIVAEKMLSIGKILWNALTMNKEGLKTALAEAVGGTMSDVFKEDVETMKAILGALKEDGKNLLNLEDFDKKMAAYKRKMDAWKPASNSASDTGPRSHQEADDTKPEKLGKDVVSYVELDGREYLPETLEFLERCNQEYEKNKELTEEINTVSLAGREYYPETLEFLARCNQEYERQKQLIEEKADVEAKDNQEDNKQPGKAQSGDTDSTQTESIWDGYIKGLNTFISKTKSALQIGKDLANSTAQAMSQSFETFFLDVFEGKLKSFKEYFKSFLKSIEQSLAKLLADQMTQAIIGGMSSMFTSTSTATGADAGQYGPANTTAGATTYNPYHSGGLIMHSGGLVPRFHVGGLAHDEVPAILQRGEYVVSRKGVAALDSINSGNIGGGGNVNVAVNVENKSSQQVNAKSSSTKFDGKQWIVGVVLEDLQSNGAISQSLRSRR